MPHEYKTIFYDGNAFLIRHTTYAVDARYWREFNNYYDIRGVLERCDLNRVRVINENSLYNIMRMICSEESEHDETKTPVRNFSKERGFRAHALYNLKPFPLVYVT